MPMLDDINDKSFEIRLVYGGTDITTHLVVTALHNDLYCAIFSFLLVLAYTIGHLRSVFLGLSSLAMIVLSFPVGIFIIGYSSDSITLGILNVLSIYIILGIGIDDCYVFVNAHENLSDDSLNNRMYATVQRAGKAMFLTSWTTSAAFLANMIASIPVILSFALFMAVLVSVGACCLAFGPPSAYC